MKTYKRYELTNHLGNVLAVISDQWRVVCNNDTFVRYEAVLVQATDYSAFGAPLSGRTWMADIPHGFRFSFNGKEGDDETGTQDYGMRIYNPGLGRFLSVDPLTKSYPMLTPYQFASNRPIDGIDLDGQEYLSANVSAVEYKFGQLRIKLENLSDATNIAYGKLKWNQNEMGPNLTIDNILYQSAAMPSATDIPFDMLPKFFQGQIQTGLNSEGYNRAGKREVQRGKGIEGPPRATGMSKSLAMGAATAEAVNQGLLALAQYLREEDDAAIKQHTRVAHKAFAIVNLELLMPKGLSLIPEQYRNRESITSIMNVVLQGSNNTNDPNIYKIGMDIFNKYNPKPDSAPNYGIGSNPADATSAAPANLPCAKDTCQE